MGRLFAYAMGLGLVCATAEARIVPGSKDLGAVWFVGDSITQGNLDLDASGSPRRYTHDLLTAAGYSFGYTGHHTVNAEGLPAGFGYHSGVSGAVIGNNVTTGTTARVGITQNIPNWWAGTSPSDSRLATVRPDVILVMLGTNDVNNNLDLANAPGRLKTLIDTIYAQPGVGDPTVFLASIAPNRTSGATDIARTAAFNAALPGVVQQLRAADKDVHFVDQFTDLEANYATAMTSDNLHPNAYGNRLIARNWFDAIDAVAVPEPAAMALVSLAAGTLLGRRRSRA
jgi:lysophospholipase L1-like esterase